MKENGIYNDSSKPNTYSLLFIIKFPSQQTSTIFPACLPVKRFAKKSSYGSTSISSTVMLCAGEGELTATFDFATYAPTETKKSRLGTINFCQTTCKYSNVQCKTSEGAHTPPSVALHRPELNVTFAGSVQQGCLPYKSFKIVRKTGGRYAHFTPFTYIRVRGFEIIPSI